MNNYEVQLLCSVFCNRCLYVICFSGASSPADKYEYVMPDIYTFFGEIKETVFLYCLQNCAVLNWHSKLTRNSRNSLMYKTCILEAWNFLKMTCNFDAHLLRNA